jgi:hypothetical protein
VDPAEWDSLEQETSEASAISWNCSQEVMVELPKSVDKYHICRLNVNVANPTVGFALFDERLHR